MNYKDLRIVTKDRQSVSLILNARQQLITRILSGNFDLLKAPYAKIDSGLYPSASSLRRETWLKARMSGVTTVAMAWAYLSAYNRTERTLIIVPILNARDDLIEAIRYFRESHRFCEFGDIALDGPPFPTIVPLCENMSECGGVAVVLESDYRAYVSTPERLSDIAAFYDHVYIEEAGYYNDLFGILQPLHPIVRGTLLVDGIVPQYTGIAAIERGLMRPTNVFASFYLANHGYPIDRIGVPIPHPLIGAYTPRFFGADECDPNLSAKRMAYLHEYPLSPEEALGVPLGAVLAEEQMRRYAT